MQNRWRVDFPVPEVADGQPHVFVSVGHQQMMTEAMPALALSVWQLTAARPMHVAGSRLFVDVTEQLASPATRGAVLAAFRAGDPLTADALEALLERPDLLPPPAAEPPPAPPVPSTASAPDEDEPDPSVVGELVDGFRAAAAAAREELARRSGPAVLDAVLADLAALKRQLFDPRSVQVLRVGMGALGWLADRLGDWLDDPGAADVLTRSVPHDVTAEMGLALLDVADAVRPHPEVVAHLREVDDDGFVARLDGLPGGPAARAAIEGWLARYGMRGPGEIDITRPRFVEQPTAILPTLLAHVDAHEPGERERRWRAGEAAARAKAEEVLTRLRALPGGEEKAAQAQRAIRRLRAFIGYREHPKHAMASRYLAYRRALLGEVRRLVADGVLAEEDDAFHLTLQELHDVVRTRRADHGLIEERRRAFRAHQALTPPRVLTSTGDVVAGAPRRTAGAPAGALVGLGVSAGVVEGRARVVRHLAGADLEPGDVLVTAHTDPAWTPLFVVAGGLVTEVGGLLTHGAVVAREYGLPAVVGVEGATARIRDGQRVRVDGTGGWVELL